MANDSCFERVILSASETTGCSCLGPAVAYEFLHFPAKNLLEICDILELLDKKSNLFFKVKTSYYFDFFCVFSDFLSLRYLPSSTYLGQETKGHVLLSRQPNRSLPNAANYW